MTKVTIFGAGITGMAVASQLSKDYNVTIVARDLPGDARSQQWSSPWAGAGWVPLGGSPRERKMQLDSLAYCVKLAKTCPESSVRSARVTDLHDVGVTTAEELWYRDCIPDFQVLDPAQFPGDQKPAVAVQYTSIVLTPTVFLSWLRSRLEAAGVTFRRISTIESLDELAQTGHDILINASGLASMTLTDVQDKSVIMDRSYTTLVKSDYDKIFVRRSATEYTYVFGRHDGTAVLGGICEPVEGKKRSTASTRANLVQRAHVNLPGDFPSDSQNDYKFVDDMEGIRPMRLLEVRVEKEVIHGQKVVHAYGTPGAYMYSFGLAREAARLVDEYRFEL